MQNAYYQLIKNSVTSVYFDMIDVYSSEPLGHIQSVQTNNIANCVYPYHYLKLQSVKTQIIMKK